MTFIGRCDSYLVDCQHLSGGKFTKKDTDGQPCTTYPLTLCLPLTEILENEPQPWHVNRITKADLVAILVTNPPDNVCFAFL
jgi:hypothetical protein